MNTVLVVSVTRPTKLVTTNLLSGPIGCTRVMASAARGALHNPHNNVVLVNGSFPGP